MEYRIYGICIFYIWNIEYMEYILYMEYRLYGINIYFHI